MAAMRDIWDVTGKVIAARVRSGQRSALCTRCGAFFSRLQPVAKLRIHSCERSSACARQRRARCVARQHSSARRMCAVAGTHVVGGEAMGWQAHLNHGRTLVHRQAWRPCRRQGFTSVDMLGDLHIPGRGRPSKRGAQLLKRRHACDRLAAHAPAQRQPRREKRRSCAQARHSHARAFPAHLHARRRARATRGAWPAAPRRRALDAQAGASDL